MKSEELKETLRLIAVVSSDPRLGPDEGDRLRTAARELEIVQRSGKLERRRLFRAVKIVTEILRDIVQSDAGQK
jgi:hypothetical protein